MIFGHEKGQNAQEHLNIFPANHYLRLPIQALLRLKQQQSLLQPESQHSLKNMTPTTLFEHYCVDFSIFFMLNLSNFHGCQLQ
jgi:hypothetical protein